MGRYFPSFMHLMHFTTKVISKLKVFSCQILRNNVGKDTKAFHSCINDKAHWSVNNLKKMKIIELLYQSIHPSLVNRSQNDGLSHFPHVYPKKEFLLRGKNKQLILQTILLTLLTHFAFIYQQSEEKYTKFVFKGQTTFEVLLFPLKCKWKQLRGKQQCSYLYYSVV